MAAMRGKHKHVGHTHAGVTECLDGCRFDMRRVPHLCPGLQIEENLKALDVLPKLTPEVMERIDSILETKPEAPSTFR